MGTESPTYFTSVVLIYFAQKYLKTLPAYATFVEMMPGAAKWAHRIVAAIGATIAAIGIHVTFDGNATEGWHFAGTIPDVWTMAHAGWDWIKVFAGQQAIYEMTKPRPWTMFPPAPGGSTDGAH